MKLSLWILKEALNKYSPEIKCFDSKIEIEEIRLADQAVDYIPGILYVGTSDQFFHDGKKTVVCCHKTDYLIIPTEDLFSVSNQLLSVFGSYARWSEQCQQMISSGCTLSELLTMGELIFRNPLHMVDATQFLIASSASSADQSYPGIWKDYLEKQSAPEEILKSFNQAYRDTFRQTNVFHLPDDYFPTSSYCKNIFINNERFATVILIEQTPLPAESTCHKMELFVPFLEQWIKYNLASDSSYNNTSHFARSLDGSPGAIPSLDRRLSLFGWEKDCLKQIIIASVVSEHFHFDAHLSRLLTSEDNGVYAIPYQEKIVLLCNLDLIRNIHTFLEHLKDTFLANNYYAASSFSFRQIDQIPQAFQQAQLAMKKGTSRAGQIYECKNIAMQYITAIVRSHSDTNLLHPLLDQLSAYDTAHRTSFYETLFCYLRNERNHQKTSEELFIHRNTLFLRLNKITSLWDLSLDDAEERFYLLYSFYQREYEKSNPADPVC